MPSPQKRRTAILGLLLAISLVVAGCSLPTPTPTPPSISGDLYVSPAGDDNNDCLSASNACATVKASVTKASSGDVIAVLAGTYTETIVVDKDLEVVGSGPGTELSGGSAGPVVTVEKSDVTLRDLAVRQGQNTEGGCVYNNGGNLVLSAVVIEQCKADQGAAIYNLGQIEVTDSRIVDNTATTYAGGLYHAANAGQATIRNSLFERNSAPTTGDTSVGGAAIVNRSGMTIEDSQIRDNEGKEAILNLEAKLSADNTQITANSSTGILAASVDQNVDASLVLTNVDLTNNGGTGINANNTSLSLDNSQVADNVSQGINLTGDDLTILNSNLLNNGLPLITGNGGGVRAINATVLIDEGEISGNHSPDLGGGIYYEDFNGVGSLSIQGVTIANNQAQEGGGLYLASGQAEVILSTFEGNVADSGGGVYANSHSSRSSGQSLSLVSTLLQANQASAGSGGGLFNMTSLTAEGSTFAGNSASMQGGGIYNGVRTLGTPSDQPRLDMVNSTISGNQADNGAGLANFGLKQLAFVTIAENQATSGGGGLVESFNPPGGTQIIRNSIIANNSSASGAANCSGPSGSTRGDNGNLEDLDSCNFQYFSLNPMLGPLQNNGGVSTSLTHLPADTSPVIDAAVSPPSGALPGTDCPPIDQRGVNRPQSTECDLGAVEVENPAATATPEAACQAELTFAEASYGSIAYRQGQADTLVILEVPAEMEQETYSATVNNQPFECSLSPDFPGQLFCVGPRVIEGAEAQLAVFGEGCSQPVFETEFSVPFPLYPTPTPTPSPTPEIAVTLPPG